MTWTKLGSEYSDDLAHHGVSDAAYRTHTEALNYLYRIEADDLRLRRSVIPRVAASENWEAAVDELIAAGFWASEGNIVRVVHHSEVLRASLTAQKKKRERDLSAQRRHRGTVSADVSQSVSADVSTDTSADVSGGVSGYADRQTDKQATRAESFAEPWSQEELNPLYCSGCDAALVGVVQRRNGRCNRCHVDAMAAKIRRIGAA